MRTGPGAPFRSEPLRGGSSGPRGSKRALAPSELQGKLSRVLGLGIPRDALQGLQAVDDAESATALLRTLIRRQVLPTNFQIPGEELARTLGIHRNTMTKVMRTLADEGYLDRRRGRPARVIRNTSDSPLPFRRTTRISHTRLAEDHRLDIRSVGVQCELVPLERLPLPTSERSEVATRLRIDDPSSRVVAYSRIRELRGPGGAWTPVIGETAYFNYARSPEHFSYLLRDPEHVRSIFAFLKEASLAVVASEYRIRVAPMQPSLIGAWAEATGEDTTMVKASRFLCFESTIFCAQGPVEYSSCSLREGYFTLSTTDLSIAIETPRLVLAGLQPARRAAGR